MDRTIFFQAGSLNLPFPLLLEPHFFPHGISAGLYCAVLNMQVNLRRRIPRPMLLAAAALAIAGCSDIKIFKAGKLPEQDPRENIQLTGVIADMTSTGTLTNRVYGKQATFMPSQNLLEFRDLKTQAFDRGTTVQSETSSKAATFYLADMPQIPRHKSDIEFWGNIHHRTPDRNDPTTDSVSLTTEQLLWDGAADRFRCSTKFQLTVSAPGKLPFRTQGDSFASTRDMHWWNVSYGIITTDSDPNPRIRVSKMMDDLTSVVREAESGMPATDAKPPTIDLPVDGTQPARIEPMQPGALPGSLLQSAQPTPAGPRQVAKIPAAGQKSGSPSTRGTPSAIGVQLPASQKIPSPDSNEILPSLGAQELPVSTAPSPAASSSPSQRSLAKAPPPGDTGGSTGITNELNAASADFAAPTPLGTPRGNPLPPGSSAAAESAAQVLAARAAAGATGNAKPTGTARRATPRPTSSTWLPDLSGR